MSKYRLTSGDVDESLISDAARTELIKTVQDLLTETFKDISPNHEILFLSKNSIHDNQRGRFLDEGNRPRLLFGLAKKETFKRKIYNKIIMLTSAERSQAYIDFRLTGTGSAQLVFYQKHRSMFSFFKENITLPNNTRIRPNGQVIFDSDCFEAVGFEVARDIKLIPSRYLLFSRVTQINCHLDWKYFDNNSSTIHPENTETGKLLTLEEKLKLTADPIVQRLSQARRLGLLRRLIKSVRSANPATPA